MNKYNNYTSILVDDFIDHIIIEEMKNIYKVAVIEGDLELGAGARSIIRYYTTEKEFDQWDHDREYIVLKDHDYGN